MSELLIRELDALRARLGRDELKILETGCIRVADPSYQDSDGWSTLAFARYVKEYGGTLDSIDLDTTVAETVLNDEGLAATFHSGYSIEVLARFAVKLEDFDVIMLDTENDAQLILHEYLVAKHLVRDKGLIVFDDIDMSEGSGAVKGHQVVPWLDGEGVTYRMEQRVSDQYITNMVFMDVP